MTKLLSKKILLACTALALGVQVHAQNIPSYTLIPVPPKNNRAVELKDPIGQDQKTSSLQDRYAAILKVVPQTLSQLNLYKYVDQWLGVRYLYGGTSKKGIDCSAFVQKVYENVFGMSLVRTAWQQFNSCMLQKNSDELIEGDLVFFKIKSSRITHVGIYLRNNYFIHASSSKGVTISNLDEPYWKRYYAGGGKLEKAQLAENKAIESQVEQLKKRL